MHPYAPTQRKVPYDPISIFCNLKPYLYRESKEHAVPQKQNTQTHPSLDSSSTKRARVDVKARFDTGGFRKLGERSCFIGEAWIQEGEVGAIDKKLHEEGTLNERKGETRKMHAEYCIKFGRKNRFVFRKADKVFGPHTH